MPSPYKHVKRILFGRPLASDRLEHERLNKKTALAVLSSDAISSVAYATDQILLVLAVLGSAALTYVVPISGVIVALLVLVALSYRQTVFAYPHGGGSYTVAKDNLGQMAGLKNMRQRAESLDGKLIIISTPGKGTILEVLIPINNKLTDDDQSSIGGRSQAIA